MPKKISFSVNIKAKNRTLGAGQTLIYDNILTNDGNGYDDRSGLFTCPVTGTYMFVVDSLASRNIWLNVKVNNNRVLARLHVGGGELKENTLIQISRTIIVKLNAGDYVKVENQHRNGRLYHDSYSGFSGSLLY